MLSWIFKKFGRTAPAPATPATSRQGAATGAPAATQQAADKAREKAQTLAAAQAEWAPRLQAALGDETALLALAQTAPLLDIKLAAVQALNSEAALKQAEREFRKQDKRLHRAAKTRLDAAVAQREARCSAQALIARAQALQAETELPVNLLSQLDGAWQALPAALLEPAQIAQFRDLSDTLNQGLRQRSELAQQQLRWAHDTRQALSDWQLAAEQAAATAAAGELSAGPRNQALHALQAGCPDTSAAAAQALLAELAKALHSSEQIEAHLRCLTSFATAPTAATEPGAAQDAEQDAKQTEDASMLLAPAPAHVEQWQALAPLADPALARLLTQRFEQWRQTHQPAAETSDTTPAAAATIAKAKRKPSPQLLDAGPAQVQQLQTLLLQAEAAQAGGLLGDMQASLQQIDAGLQGLRPGSLPEALRTRHQALLAERKRLREWEQWGGARALDALVAEAESLAQASLAARTETSTLAAPAQAAEAAAAAPPSADSTAPAPAATAQALPPAVKPAKPSLKAQREAIQDLRKRWRELERLSGGAGHALWPRFDAALHTANKPVAAQLAELKRVREANLASRELLLAELDAFAEPADGFANLAGENAAVYWKEALRALAAFQLAWRQLGPVEHTVPLVHRDALLQRQRASLARLEMPLQQARRGAEAQRALLITQAEGLLQDLQKDPQARDLVGRVRELQAEWQNQARSLPLARAVENDLWARFKAATDAVFAQRSAAFEARDAELAQTLAAYEHLLERLSALTADSADAEIRRTLAEVDRDWRHAGDLPRATENSLNKRLQTAHQAALQILAGRARLQWQAECAALAAKLRLSQEREQSGASADFQQRWDAAGTLPPDWEQALAQRARAPAAADLERALLQLEAALDLPCSAELMAARRQLKLQAMKEALEGRSGIEQGPAQVAALWLQVLAQRPLNDTQSQRLDALAAALPAASSGMLGAP